MSGLLDRRARPTQAGLDLVVAGFFLPALAVGPGELQGGGGCGIGVMVVTRAISSPLPLAVAAGDLILDDPHPHRLARVKALARQGGGDHIAPGLAVQGGPGHDREVRNFGQQFQHVAKCPAGGASAGWAAPP
jgi:hypothetical protein